MDNEGKPIEEILEESGRIVLDHRKKPGSPELCINQTELAKKVMEHERSIPKNRIAEHKITIFGPKGSHKCSCGKSWEVI